MINDDMTIGDKVYNVDFEANGDEIYVPCRPDEWPGHGFTENVILVVVSCVDLDDMKPITDKSILGRIEKEINEDEGCIESAITEVEEDMRR